MTITAYICCAQVLPQFCLEHCLVRTNYRELLFETLNEEQSLFSSIGILRLDSYVVPELSGLLREYARNSQSFIVVRRLRMNSMMFRCFSGCRTTLYIILLQPL
uniref:Uncharacterized protein n=1 Tax=Sipha flava TaxID=143950 RepID=A0A2S2Q7F6_9HEMI